MNELLESIRGRKSRKSGIVTADRYLRSLDGCFNGGFCPTSMLANCSNERWAQLVKESAERLVYRDKDMQVGEFRRDMTPNSILDFDAVITSTRKDRDGDILESGGADLDPNAPLLWQHNSAEPIGKLVQKTGQSKDNLSGRFAIANTALGRDAATLLEFGALRISHGFDPTDYEPLKGKDAGWHIRKFNIVEVSLVSVPANVDAVITAFTTGKLHSSLVKGWAGSLKSRMPRRFKGYDIAELATKVAAEIKNGESCSCKSSKSAQPQLSEQEIEELRAAGHGRYVGSCGHVIRSCRCIHGSQIVVNLDHPCDKCAAESKTVTDALPDAEAKPFIKGAIPYHSRPTADRTHEWDADAAKKHLEAYAKGDAEKFDLSDAGQRKRFSEGFALVTGDGTNIGDYHLPHEDVIDGKLHVIYRGVVAAIAALNGARGGTDFSEGERREAYDHLVKHLKEDFKEKEVPPLKSDEPTETKTDATMGPQVGDNPNGDTTMGPQVKKICPKCAYKGAQEEFKDADPDVDMLDEHKPEETPEDEDEKSGKSVVKSGRKLSKKNTERLEDIKGHMDHICGLDEDEMGEHGRPIKAMCKQVCCHVASMLDESKSMPQALDEGDDMYQANYGGAKALFMLGVSEHPKDMQEVRDYLDSLLKEHEAREVLKQLECAAV